MLGDVSDHHEPQSRPEREWVVLVHYPLAVARGDEWSAEALCEGAYVFGGTARPATGEDHRPGRVAQQFRGASEFVRAGMCRERELFGGEEPFVDGDFRFEDINGDLDRDGAGSSGGEELEGIVYRLHRVRGGLGTSRPGGDRAGGPKLILGFVQRTAIGEFRAARGPGREDNHRS